MQLEKIQQALIIPHVFLTSVDGAIMAGLLLFYRCRCGDAKFPRFAPNEVVGCCGSSRLGRVHLEPDHEMADGR